MFLLSEFYFRLKNLIIEDLPSLKVINNYCLKTNAEEKIINEKTLIAEELNKYLN